MFKPFEWMIAWRYLRAKRSEGGISVMTWISLIGITLAVFALIVTMAVRAGLRHETVQILLGASAHLEVRFDAVVTETGAQERFIRDYDAVAERIRAVPGVTDAVPVVRGKLIATARGQTAPIEMYGVRPNQLARFESIAQAETTQGDFARLPEGIALGEQVARALGVGIGDNVRIISPDGAPSPMGTRPRVGVYELVYIFRSGQAFIDNSRAYMPLDVAQPFLNRQDAADQIEVMIERPEAVQDFAPAILDAAGPRAHGWTWQDRAGAMLRALDLQDTALYVLLGIVVLIATLNIVSGLVMLVKNKGRDIGILRTIGLSQGSILRVFILVGASVGVAGTVLGVILGALFSINIDYVYAVTDWLTGSDKARLEEQGFFFPPAILRPTEVLAAMALSLLLAFVVTIFPARRAARMNPIEALRYE